MPSSYTSLTQDIQPVICILPAMGGSVRGGGGGEGLKPLAEKLAYCFVSPTPFFRRFWGWGRSGAVCGLRPPPAQLFKQGFHNVFALDGTRKFLMHRGRIQRGEGGQRVCVLPNLHHQQHHLHRQQHQHRRIAAFPLLTAPAQVPFVH